MIDKNGKLFGKINVIDLLIILIVIAAIALLALRGLGVIGSGGSDMGEAHRVRITFFGDYVSDYVPESLTIGDPVSEHSFNTDLGELVSFESEPGYELVYDESKGEFLKKFTLNHVWLTFTCETTGYMGDMGFTKDDTRFVVGGNYYINVGPSRAAYQIKAFEVLD